MTELVISEHLIVQVQTSGDLAKFAGVDVCGGKIRRGEFDCEHCSAKKTQAGMAE
jgi:hypothetical protein